MIKSLYLKNFTVFKELSIDFSQKINVIIGENGTGKTHILKAIYSMCGSTGLIQSNEGASIEKTKQIIADSFIGVFKPLDDVIGRLKKTGETGDDAIVQVEYPDEKKIRIAFNANTDATKNANAIKKYYNDTSASIDSVRNSKPVFIPAKEILSWMLGLQSIMKEYHLSFDKTYSDLITKLELPAKKPSEREERTDTVMRSISNICGGEFMFKGGGNVTFKANAKEYSVNATAEGYRKLGTLYRLIDTGSIKPGISGTLLWDEPDANLNPMLIKRLVEALYSIAHTEQQIIIATHSYNLIKWIDLLFNGEQNDHVTYHSLFDDGTGNIRVTSTNEYNLIEHNAILDAFGDISKGYASKRILELTQ